jgi:hypothetical protein
VNVFGRGGNRVKVGMLNRFNGWSPDWGQWLLLVLVVTSDLTSSVCVTSDPTSGDVRLTSGLRWPDENDEVEDSITRLRFVWFSLNFVHLPPHKTLEIRVCHILHFLQPFYPKILSYVFVLCVVCVCVFVWHVPCCMHVILVYHCNNDSDRNVSSYPSGPHSFFQVVIKTLQFTNFRCTPLNSMNLFHLMVYCLRVVSIYCLYVWRVCFDCSFHQWCTVDLYFDSSSSERPYFQRKKKSFVHFFKK